MAWGKGVNMENVNATTYIEINGDKIGRIFLSQPKKATTTIFNGNVNELLKDYYANGGILNEQIREKFNLK